MYELDPVELKRVIKVIETEKQCVLRNVVNHCDRKCENCDLVLPDSDVIGAYNYCLAVLYGIGAEQAEQRYRENKPNGV